MRFFAILAIVVLVLAACGDSRQSGATTTPPVTSTTAAQTTTPPVTSTTAAQTTTPPVTSTTAAQTTTPPVTSTTATTTTVSDTLATSLASPAAVIQAYIAAYNAGDIDGVMALFTEESEVTGQFFYDASSVGLEEIRGVLLFDMYYSAEVDAYEIFNIEVSDNIVMWDHVWTASNGVDFCAEGHSAVIEDGKILAWTWPPTFDSCP